jgi:hypothetical protein
VPKNKEYNNLDNLYKELKSQNIRYILEKDNAIENGWFGDYVKNPGTVDSQLSYLNLEVVDSYQNVKWYRIK